MSRTEDAPGTNEHVHRAGCALECGGDEHDDSSHENGETTTETICHVWREGVCAEAADVLQRGVVSRHFSLWYNERVRRT